MVHVGPTCQKHTLVLNQKDLSTSGPSLKSVASAIGHQEAQRPDVVVVPGFSQDPSSSALAERQLPYSTFIESREQMVNLVDVNA